MLEQVLGKSKPSRICKVNFREGLAVMTSSRARSQGATVTHRQHSTGE